MTTCSRAYFVRRLMPAVACVLAIRGIGLNRLRSAETIEANASRDKIADDAELKIATIQELFSARDSRLPERLRSGPQFEGDRELLFAAIKEPVFGAKLQRKDFQQQATHRFILLSIGHPTLRVKLTNGSANDGDGKLQGVWLEVVAADRGKIVTGAAYSLIPINNDGKFRWQVAASTLPLIFAR